jgi:hypothetical protein
MMSAWRIRKIVMHGEADMVHGNARKFARTAFSAALIALSAGCITFEHEIFLNEDGSGTYVLHLAAPKASGDELGAAPPGGDAGDLMEKIKKGLKESHINGISPKSVKSVAKRGLEGFYMIFEFNDVRGIGDMFKELGALEDEEEGKEGKTATQAKGEAGKGGKKNRQEEIDWKMELKKKGKKTHFVSTYLMPGLQKPGEGEKKQNDEEKKAGSEDMPDSPFGGMGEMMDMVMGTARVRFVLHAPSDISESNADIVIGGQAVWEASLSMFMERKAQMKMKAVF